MPLRARLTRQHDRIPGDVELVRELAARRQFVPGRQRPRQDAIDQFLPNLFLQIQRATGVQVNNCIRHIARGWFATDVCDSRRMGSEIRSQAA